MAVLQKKPGILSVAECEERLEKNPDDPDPQVQAYKQFQEKSAERWQPIINAELALVRKSALGIFQEPSFLSSLRMMNESLSSMFLPLKMMNESLKSPLFSILNTPTKLGEGLSVMGIGAAAKEAQEVVQRNNTQLDKILESVRNAPLYEPMHITHLPESPQIRMARIEGKLDRILEGNVVDKSETIQVNPQLVRIYPSDNKKYKVPRNILSLLMQQTSVNTFYVAKLIDRNLTKKQFSNKEARKKVEGKVENVIRGIRRNIKKYGYSVSIKSEYVELVETKK